MATICFDLDGTLCTNTDGAYEDAQPFPWAIGRVNALKRAGNRILIFTARGGTTGIDWRPVTEAQLERWGVEYDELRLGKPQADVYVDDKALHADAWRYGHARELTGPGHAPPRSASVLAVGRTYGGELYGVESDAAHLLHQARDLSIPLTYSRDEIVATIEPVAAAQTELVRSGDDVVYAVSLAAAPHAAFLDTTDGEPAPELIVTCRLLSQLAPALAELGGPGGVAATTEPAGEPGRWPLVAHDGILHGTLGADVACAKAGSLYSDGKMTGSPAWALMRRLTGAIVPERPYAEAPWEHPDELVLIGMPFCLLPVTSVDGKAVGSGQVGPVAQRLRDAWSDAVGIDLGAQLERLAR